MTGEIILEKEIKEMLIDIATKAYNKKPPYFILNIVTEERKTMNGQYWPLKKQIDIFNLSRPTQYVLCTTIHELVHHLDYCYNNNLAHDKSFYSVFKTLLEAAIKSGYLTYDIIRQKCDSVDIIQLEKYFGPITVEYDENYDNNKDKVLFKVLKSYEIRNKLSEMGYSYNGIEKNWYKKLSDSDVESEKDKILELSKSVEFSVDTYRNLQINLFYYIIVTGDTFSCKDELKKQGYKFKGYGIKGNAWVKRIDAKDIDEENISIERLKRDYSEIKVKVKNTTQPKKKKKD